MWNGFVGAFGKDLLCAGSPCPGPRQDISLRDILHSRDPTRLPRNGAPSILKRRRTGKFLVVQLAWERTENQSWDFETWQVAHDIHVREHKCQDASHLARHRRCRCTDPNIFTAASQIWGSRDVKMFIDRITYRLNFSM